MIFTNSKINTQIAGQVGYDKDYVQKTSEQIQEYQQYSWLLKG